MKLKKYFLLLALGILAFTMQSCDDDDNDGIPVPSELSEALAWKHPNARHIEWEMKGAYYVADFHEDNLEKEAWFTMNGIWQMTETDYGKNLFLLPDAVKKAFGESQYAGWKVDDIDKLDRPDMESVYIIEAEQGNREVYLHYSEDGMLVKESGNTGGSQYPGQNRPTGMSEAIKAFLNENYPNARIIEVDVERGMTEVDIIHENRVKDVLFASDDTWISTSWDVHVSLLPDAVRKAVEAQYPGYFIDDADFVETPSGSYYWVEVEQGGGREFHVKVTEKGEILP